MIDYATKRSDKLVAGLVEHLYLVGVSLVLSLVFAAVIALLCAYSKTFSRFCISLFSGIYSIPSLALFALMIPLTGLGTTSAIIALVIYNQYLLLRNFISGLEGVDPALVEAATGMGMTTFQILVKIRLPLAKASLFAGIRIALVSTIGIATIAATINAGGLGTLLFDGLRTQNYIKIIWGSILSAGLAIGANALLGLLEKRFQKGDRPPSS